MTFSSKQGWQVHRLPLSDHMTKCSRCHQQRIEAGIIEVHSVKGDGHWHLCQQCLVEFILFTANQGTIMPSVIDPDFEYAAQLLADDIDIAEHHATCRCYDCVVDPDQHRKFELENHREFQAERQSA